MLFTTTQNKFTIYNSHLADAFIQSNRHMRFLYNIHTYIYIYLYTTSKFLSRGERRHQAPQSSGPKHRGATRDIKDISSYYYYFYSYCYFSVQFWIFQCGIFTRHNESADIWTYSFYKYKFT